MKISGGTTNRDTVISVVKDMVIKGKMTRVLVNEARTITVLVNAIALLDTYMM